MNLEFTKHQQMSLKSHPDFSEKWLQDQICADPAILGLGDEVVVLVKEKVQPGAGLNAGDYEPLEDE